MLCTQVRLGEVGGNALGFLAAVWGSSSRILGHSWGGALHLWRQGEGRSGKATHSLELPETHKSSFSSPPGGLQR